MAGALRSGGGGRPGRRGLDREHREPVFCSGGVTCIPARFHALEYFQSAFAAMERDPCVKERRYKRLKSPGRAGMVGPVIEEPGASTARARVCEERGGATSRIHPAPVINGQCAPHASHLRSR